MAVGGPNDDLVMGNVRTPSSALPGSQAAERTAEPLVLGWNPLVWLQHRTSQVFKGPLAPRRGSHASHAGRVQICCHAGGTAFPAANPL